MKINLFVSALIIFFSNCRSNITQDPENEITQPVNRSEPERTVKTEIIVFKNDTMRMPVAGGYGYIIKVEGNPYIFQPTIPAVSGNKGFASAEDAEKTAGLVAYKLRNNITPPALTVQELDSLSISK